MTEIFLPREDLVREVSKNLLRGRGVLLTGPEGVGKTFIAQEVIAELDLKGLAIAYIPSGRAFKQVVIGIAEILHSLNELHVDGIDLGESWDKVAGRLWRPSADKVAPAVIECLGKSELIVVLDQFDAPWPRYLSYYKQIFDIATVLVITDQAHTSRMAQLKSYFRTLEVQKLSKEEASELADQMYEFYEINCPDADGFKRKVVFIADGLPLQMRMMFEDASKEGVVTRDYLRALEKEGPKQFINMGFLFLLLLVGAVGLRYLALGSGDTDLYVTAGILTSIGMIFRYFIIRGMR